MTTDATETSLHTLTISEVAESDKQPEESGELNVFAFTSTGRMPLGQLIAERKAVA